MWADPISGGDGFLVTLDCGHKLATREQRTAYHCRTCDGPPKPHDPIDSIRRSLAGGYSCADRSAEEVAALLVAHDMHAADADRLRGQLGAAVDAHEDDLLAVWRALGGEHEPPADAGAVVNEVRRMVGAYDTTRAVMATLAGAVRAYATACDESDNAALAVDMIDDDVLSDDAAMSDEFIAAVERARKARRSRTAARITLNAALAVAEGM